MNSEQLVYREYKDTDLKDILDLWEFHSDWGRPEEDEFRNWMKTPYGKSDIIVAEDKNQNIVSQMIFSPSSISFNGQNEPALKISAPIIHSEVRKGSLLTKDHIVIQMVLFETAKAIRNNYLWFYNFPAHGWKKFLENLRNFGFDPWKVEEFDCYQITEVNTYNHAYKLKVLDKCSDDIQMVWDLFKRRNPSWHFIRKDLDYLNYNWGSMLHVGFYDTTDVLLGYAGIRLRDRLLLDFCMNKNHEFSVALAALSSYCQEQFHQHPALQFMATPILKSLTESLKKEIVNFKFVFGLCSVSAIKNVDEIDLKNWYIFPND
jgi:hypothetical protein